MSRRGPVYSAALIASNRDPPTMKTLQKVALFGALACFLPACSQTKGSLQSQSLGEVSMQLCAEGAQVDFLQGLEGSYEVIYQVFLSPEGPAEVFEGTVEYTWNSEMHMLLGTHDAKWGKMPYQSTMVMAYDTEQQSYVIGWSNNEGMVTVPMVPVQPTGVSGEISANCRTGNIQNRTVMTMQDSNMHSVRRHVNPDNASDRMVLEMTCVRQ